MKFRYLAENEIQCRVAQIGSSEKCGVWFTALLYKNARADMDLLDETVGPENWQREHYECKGNLFCRVGIRQSDGTWVWKADCGSESNTEAEKGEASDSFKRACVNWGIGRELYTSPAIFIPQMGKDGKENFKVKSKNGKDYPDVALEVTCFKVENGRITALNIENRKTRRTVFAWGNLL